MNADTLHRSSKSGKTHGYAALTQDLSDAAKAAGPKAAKKLAVADRFTRQFMNTSAKTLEKIGKFDSDERAFNFAMTLTKDGVQQLTRLRRAFTPEEWDVVAGTVLGRMGLARPGAQNVAGDAFSVSTFLTNWSRMSPEAKRIMFGGERYRELAPALDDLVAVVSSLTGVEKLTNTSNTARNMIAWMTLQTLVGGAGGAAVGGDFQSAGLGVVGVLVAPRLAARLITSPRFVKWLTTPLTSPTGLSAHLGRLVGIAKAEPELAEAIDQYVAALRATPAPGAAGGGS